MLCYTKNLSLGYLKRSERGHEVYGIKACKVLIPVFGENSVQFLVRTLSIFLPYSHECTQIQRQAPVEEFALSGEEITSERGGHVLTFTLVPWMMCGSILTVSVI